MKITIPNYKFRMTNFRRRPLTAAAHSQFECALPRLPLPAAAHSQLEIRNSKFDSALPREPLLPPSAAANSQFAIRNSQFQSGVALVITLIMLAVTLVMAVAFLAVARRERNSVTTTTDTATARLAADTALAAAQAQIAANLIASANSFNYGLLVSTTYQNPAGYFPNVNFPTNVNYDDRNGGGSLNAADMVNNINNLYLQPRPPVFVPNATTGSNEFRFYLDLNRNGQFETNGLGQEFDANGNIIGNAIHVGDPELVGVLERPDQPHGPNNKFVARYAFLAQPVGNALDLNYIHNQTINPNLPNLNTAAEAKDGYFRNEGVGSWELNLAAFLADLNTNQWDPPTIMNPGVNNPYTYLEPNNANKGTAFEDAFWLLAWRYNYNYNSLADPPSYFYYALVNHGVDGYTLGSLMTSPILPVVNAPLNGPNAPWAGSDNTNRYFSLPSDLFDSTKYLGNFPTHLSAAGTNSATYDRYTFYRLLDELGTDSTADSGKLNLNYSNAVVTYDTTVDHLPTSIAILPGAETNAVPWQPLDFFTAAADRLLRTYSTNWFAANPTNYLATYFATNVSLVISPNGYGMPALTNVTSVSNQVPSFGITNIPVYVNGVFVYSPAVNRLLQLAANIYDASTNVSALAVNNGINYPTVFRPMFRYDASGNVFIAGFTTLSPNGVHNTVSGINDPQFGPPHDVSQLPLLSGTTPGVPVRDINGLVNVYGVPWIIGAKKGFPAFNQFSMVNSAQFERLLEVVRPTVSALPNSTNQMVMMAISNNLMTSFWNSYSNDYVGAGNINIFARNTVQMVLTNSAGFYASRVYSTYYTNNLNFWPGSKWTGNEVGQQPSLNSFLTYGVTNILVPDYLAYDFADHIFVGTNDIYQRGWDSTLSPLPQWGMMTTNWLQAYIVDGSHVIDYVQLRGPIDYTNLTAAVQDYYPFYTGGSPYYMWSTNLNTGGLTYGIVEQLLISSAPVGSGFFPLNNPIPGIPNTPLAQTSFFAAASTTSHSFNYTTTGIKPVTTRYYNNQLVTQAPYTATRTIFGAYLYQINDPLVHYLASDLDSGNAIWSPGGTSAMLVNGIWLQNNNGANNGTISYQFPVPPGTNIANFNQNNSRYQPWGQTLSQSGLDYSANNLSYKDPLVRGSDFWDFPTNQYPTVGWLGRVHRGTPWQTVYLKATDILQDPNVDGKGNPEGPTTWAAWTGDKNGHYYQNGQYYFDATNSAPVQDELLFDLFTTGLNDNATRGTLSVNQSGLAAWSAVFSGLTVPTSLTNSYTVISPAGVAGTGSGQLGPLVTNINNARATFTNTDGLVGSFEHVGNILHTAALTEKSPFLDPTIAFSDELYEWLPQQVLGLLRVSSSPRFVIYCYGQTLRPAPNSVVTSSGQQYFGLVTNYQITAESSARAVLRVDSHITPTGTNYSTVIESYTPLPPN